MAADEQVTAAWQVENLHYAYHDGTEALRGVSLEVAAGQKVAIVGANGAGKSTLFLCSLGILDGWSGSVRFFGAAASAGRFEEIRRRVGLVFQEPDDMLFMPTVEDDVAFAPLNAGLDADAVHKRIEQALRAVGMWERRGRPGHHLSAGEKRRAALATVLAAGAEMIFFDEPTSGLDPRGRRQFLELLAALDATVVIATHDLTLAAATGRTYIMSAGRIVAESESSRLLSDTALLETHGL